jgi:hypothetical protein
MQNVDHFHGSRISDDNTIAMPPSVRRYRPLANTNNSKRGSEGMAPIHLSRSPPPKEEAFIGVFHAQLAEIDK